MPDYTVRFKRSTSEKWASRNPILAPGEPGYEVDTGRMKIGQVDDTGKGVPWNSLGYFYPSQDVINAGLAAHYHSESPHPDWEENLPSFVLIYQNKKV